MMNSKVSKREFVRRFKPGNLIEANEDFSFGMNDSNFADHFAVDFNKNDLIVVVSCGEFVNNDKTDFYLKNVKFIFKGRFCAVFHLFPQHHIFTKTRTYRG